MDHLGIFLHIIILMVGACSVFYTWQVSRTFRNALFRSILCFIIFYNLVIVIDLTARYSCLNLMEDCLLYYSTTYAKITGPLSSFFFLLMTYFLVTIILNFQEKAIPGIINKFLIIGFCLLSVTYISRIILSLFDIFYDWIVIIQFSIFQMAIITAFIFLALLLLQRQKFNNSHRKKLVTAFGSFYLTGFAFLAMSRFLADPTRGLYVSAIFLLINLFPIFWIRRYFLPYQSMQSATVEGGTALDLICQQYSISRREREIAELILQGKSNKEIEHRLFISLHTVKNHIYNLYQKLGINSRGQLVNVILEAQRQQ